MPFLELKKPWTQTAALLNKGQSYSCPFRAAWCDTQASPRPSTHRLCPVPQEPSHSVALWILPLVLLGRSSCWPVSGGEDECLSLRPHHGWRLKLGGRQACAESRSPWAHLTQVLRSSRVRRSLRPFSLGDALRITLCAM
uniref:Uncharacterized protein n=1 Tax=Gorilla gorilla gorilla TaxID=9595 RepID=A0A2I2YMY8_GORGO